MSLLVSIAHDSEMLSEKSNQKKLLKIMTIAPNPEDYVGSVKTRSRAHVKINLLLQGRTQPCAEGISGLKSSFLATYS